MSPRILVFDLETRKHASDLRPDDIDAGWEELRAGDGGISALAIYDSVEKWTYVYDDHEMTRAAQHLENADILVGFCSEKFDLPVIEGLLGRKLRIRQHIDIYTLLAQTNAHKGILGQKGDFTLDSVCKRNIGRGKSGSGAHAPELAKKGKWAELFRYCMDDVRLTRDLFIHLCKSEGLMNLNQKFLPLTIPDWIRRAMLEE